VILSSGRAKGFLFDYGGTLEPRDDRRVSSSRRSFGKAAAARLGLSAKDLWFAGDRLDTDMIGAKSAGMTTVWFNPSQAPAPDYVDHSLSRWQDLVE
jgi:hypothetical protein